MRLVRRIASTQMLSVIDGNLLDADTKYIAHQTNCITRRAAHLAKSVFERFPHADIYSPRKAGQVDTPGTIVIKGDGDKHRYVVNMLGQVYPGKPKFPDSRRDGALVRQRYFFNCLKSISNIEDLQSIAFPWGVGCGAAGGDWNLYHELISKFAEHVKNKAEVRIYKLINV